MMNGTLKNIRERRSIRKYLTEQVAEQELETILNAGTWAATGKGGQSPVMVVVQDAQTLEELSRANAKILGNPAADPFYGAPTAVVVLADGEKPTWLQDGSLVMGNLMLAAHSVGVGSCWINRATEYFDMPEGKAMLRKWNLPETLRGVAFCILGYAAGEAPVPAARKENYIVRV